MRIFALILLVYFNVHAYHMFKEDKGYAVHHEERIPEDRLLLWTALGGWGALRGIVGLRHKSQKWQFILTAAGSALLQTAFVLFV